VSLGLVRCASFNGPLAPGPLVTTAAFPIVSGPSRVSAREPPTRGPSLPLRLLSIIELPSGGCRSRELGRLAVTFELQLRLLPCGLEHPDGVGNVLL
jgi:hypothetical protein